MKILIILFICHYLADYSPLSNTWMLNAKKFGKPLLPILVHSFVHSLLMGICLYAFNIENYLYLSFIQLITHFLIDVFKGKINFYFEVFQSPINKPHWMLFGFDQLLHSIVIVYMYNLTL